MFFIEFNVKCNIYFTLHCSVTSPCSSHMQTTLLLWDAKLKNLIAYSNCPEPIMTEEGLLLC